MTDTPTIRQNPFIGPRAFETGEKLYGRSRETNQLVNLLIAERIVLLYSPSGAGKTSLLNLLTGFEWNILLEDYRYDSVPYLPSIDLYNPVETAVEGELAFYPYLSGDVENSVIAPYIIDRIGFTEKVYLTLGLRYDIIDFSNDAAGYETDRSFQNPSPILGLSYSPVPAVSI